MQHEPSHKGVLCFYADTQESWRNWLASNHKVESSVWLIIYKVKTAKPSITLGEAIDTALCFGWIDSKKNSRDEESYYSYFTQRNPKSNWSRINKEKIQRLENEGLLTPAAIEMIHIAKESGTWDALNDVENLIIPEDLLLAFKKHNPALNHWNTFPRNVKRSILEWILNAKRPSTRQNRIQKTTEHAQKGIRVDH